MSNKYFEVWWPFGLSVVVWILYLTLLHGHSDPQMQKYILSATVSVSGIAIGFLSTSQSILLTIRSSRIVSYLRKNDVYEGFKHYIRMAIYSSFLLLSLSIIGLTKETWPLLFLSLWVFALIFAGSNCFRAIFLFQQVIHTFDASESKREDNKKNKQK